MAGYSPERAMREFLRRGGRDQAGLDELARRVAERRRELTQQHNLDGTLQEVKELLDRAVLAERKQLARDVDMDEGDRALAQMQLDNLPSSPAAAVNELNDYDWRSSEARRGVREDQGPAGPGGPRPALRRHEAGAGERDRRGPGRAERDARPTSTSCWRSAGRGEDTQEQFDEFMAKHGDYFPEQPQNLDELLDALAARAAAAQRMRNSMTQEQRDELDALAQQAFGSSDLIESLSQLDDNLQSLRPGEDWGGSERMDGENGLGLGDGTGVFQDLADLDALAEQLAQSYQGSQLDDLDLEKLARQLGDDAAGRRPHPAAAGAGAARLRHDAARLRRPARADPEGHAPARQGGAARRRRDDVRPARGSTTCAAPAPPASRRGRPASGRSATPSRGT